jgi:WD40 repeat protein
MACQQRFSSLQILLWLSFFVCLWACATVAAQEPELEEQTNGSELPNVQAMGQAVFGPHGDWLAISENQQIAIYDVKAGRVSRRIPAAEKSAIAAHPSANTLAIFSEPNALAISSETSITVYDVLSGKVLWNRALLVPCSFISFNADGSRLVGICQAEGSGQGIVENWNAVDGSPLPRPKLPDDLVASGPFSNDGWWVVCSKKHPAGARHIVSASKDHLVVDLETGQALGNVEGGSVLGVSAKTHTALVLSPGMNKRILLDVVTGKALSSDKAHGWPRTAQVSHDGSNFLVMDGNLSDVSIVNATTGQVTHPSWRPVAAVAAAIGPDGDQLAFATAGIVTLSRTSHLEETRTIGNPDVLDRIRRWVQPDASEHESRWLLAKQCGEQTRKIRNSQDHADAFLACIEKAEPGSLDCEAIYLGMKNSDALAIAGAACQDKLLKNLKEGIDLSPEGQSSGRASYRMISTFGSPRSFPPLTVYLDSGRLIAVLGADASWALWDAATGNHLSFHKPFDSTKPISVRAFDPTKPILVQDRYAWLRDSFHIVEKEFGLSQSDIDFDHKSSKAGEARSTDGRQLFTYYPHPGHENNDPNDQLLLQEAGLHVFDAASRKPLFDIPEALTVFGPPAVLPKGKVLIGPEQGNTVGIWNRNTGERLGTLYALQEGEWLLTTPSGFFDGSPRGWNEVAWRLPNEISTLPCEAFFNEFFRPGLLAELLEGHAPRPPRDMAQIDRRQAIVSLSGEGLTTAQRTVSVHIQLAEAAPGAGVRDARLFRNGTLVKAWRGDFALNNGRAQLDAAVPLITGENRFVAYAFNHDNVKSEDAVLSIQGTAPARKGTAYILAVGVNRYSNPEFDLRFAVPDAQYLAQTLSETETNLGDYRKVVAVNLLDQEATRANILLALSILAGSANADLPAGAPAQLANLKPSQPEDMVAIYFAGHGLAWDDHFYMIPQDLGYSGPRQALSQSLQSVLRSSISDLDLEQAFAPLDAAHILLIIDACNSGKLLDAEDQRRGPMNSKGLAQLAYEKGIYVLTAAQAYQAALESEKIGHGYLTYALAEEGLKTPLADTRPKDGQISAVEWFEYASERVPQIQNENLSQPRSFVFELDQSGTVPHNRLQTPRLYYRRDQPGGEAIVARMK